MGRRALVAAILLVLALAALVTWFVLSGGRPSPAPLDGPDAVVAGARDAAPDPRRERVALPSDAVVPIDAGPAGDEQPPNDVDPWPDAGVEIDVLVADGRATVPGAVVHALVRTPDEWMRHTRPDASARHGADEQGFLRQSGRPFRADEYGHVRVPAPPAGGHLWIGCTHGDLVGQLGVRSDDAGAPQEIMLLPRVRLRVRVVDAAGRSLYRFPVHLVEENPWGTNTTALAETGLGGIAIFHDLGDLREWGDEDDTRVFVRAGIPMADPPQALLDMRDPPTEPLELVIPPTGSVRVIAQAPEGTPQLQRAYVSLVIDDGRPRWHDTSRVLVADLVFGVATFPYVGTGTQLLATVVDEDERLASLESRFAGPTRARERVVHVLRLHGQRLVVVGRVVDEHAAPVAQLHVSAGAKAEGDDAWMDALGVTDAAGRFRMVLDHSRRDTLGRRLVVYASERIGAGGRPRQILELSLPPALPDGPLDLGDVVLAPQAAVVAGRMVDTGGRPVAGVPIGAEFRDGARWVVVRIRGESDEDGHFALRGEIDEGISSVRLVPQDEEHVLRNPAEVDVGTQDAVLEVTRAGTLVGSLRLPAGVKGEDFEVTVAGSAPDRLSYRHGGPGLPSRARVHDDGRFEASGLVDGTADVEVRFDGVAAPLIVVRGVAIVAGRVNRDARLDGIDLTKKLSPREIKVVGGDGAAVPQALVHFRPSGSNGDWHDARADGSGRVEVSAPAGPHDVLAMAPGYASASAVGAENDVTLRLARAVPVTVEVVLAADSAVPAPPRKVVVTLAWLAPVGSDAPDVESEDLDWWDPRGVGMDELPLLPGDRATFTAPEPGWYAVQTMIEHDELAHYSQWSIPAAAGGEPFEITPGAGKRRIVLRLTEANLTAND